MGLLLARLVFLAFIGLTGFITYNALYLQSLRSAAMPRELSAPAWASQAPSALERTSLPAVTTDPPPSYLQEAPEPLVAAIQRELAARGYKNGPADGKLRDETRKAIAAFEKDKGLPVSGSPTDALLRFILLGETIPAGPNTGSVAKAEGSAPVVPPSAKPKAEAPKTEMLVKQLQQILADLGYAPGPIDGAMGSETVRAVSAFQRDRKLAPNGRITPELLLEIKRVTGRDLASKTQAP